MQTEDNLCNRFNEQTTEKSYDFNDENFLGDVLDIEDTDANDVEKSIQCHSVCDGSDKEESNFKNIDTDGNYNHLEEHCDSDMVYSEYDTESECESDTDLPEISNACYRPQVNT